MLLQWKTDCTEQEQMLQRLVRRQVNAIFRDVEDSLLAILCYQVHYFNKYLLSAC